MTLVNFVFLHFRGSCFSFSFSLWTKTRINDYAPLTLRIRCVNIFQRLVQKSVGLSLDTKGESNRRTQDLPLTISPKAVISNPVFSVPYNKTILICRYCCVCCFVRRINHFFFCGGDRERESNMMRARKRWFLVIHYSEQKHLILFRKSKYMIYTTLLVPLFQWEINGTCP